MLPRSPHFAPLRFVAVALAGWLSQQQQDVIDYLCGDRKEIPTEPDPLATGRQTLDEPAAALPAYDFGLQLNFRPIIQPNGLIRVRVRPQIMSVNFGDATLRQGRYEHLIPVNAIQSQG